MSPKITIHQQSVLDVLDFDGAFTTSDVAKQVSFRAGHNNRIHSAFVRRILIQLEKLGLVVQADNDKPAIWKKVRP